MRTIMDREGLVARGEEGAPPRLLPGGGIRGAGRPAARRAREAPPQGREAERALDRRRHGVPHPRRQALPPPDNRLLRRHADELGDVRLPGRRDGELVAHGRMCPAQGGRASQGAQRPRLPLPLAGVDQDMRRPRHREVDAGGGVQSRQRKGGGALREAEGRVPLREGLGRGYARWVRGRARRVPEMAPRRQAEERPGLQGPDAISEGPGPDRLGRNGPGFPPQSQMVTRN